MHSVNNTPVRFEFVFNSNDSLKSKDNKYRINKYVKNATMRKSSRKLKGKARLLTRSVRHSGTDNN